MERGFQAMLLRGEGSGDGSPPAFIGQTADDTCINALYSAMNAQSSSSPFLSVSDEKYLLQSLDYGYGTLPAAPSVDPVTFGYVGEDWKLKSVDYVDEKLKMPKYETVDYDLVSDVSTEPFDFISKSSDSVSNSRFQQLPDLRSLEPVQETFAFADSTKKRVRSTANYFTGFNKPEIQAPGSMMPQSELARQRRQRISEKTRCLQKLLPWDKKMDMATMLEEAYKYVKFLQAQISVLKSMPADSPPSCFSTQNPTSVNVFGGLGRLNRQQLLQVMVNSPVVQTKLFSRGLCVYSIEQLVHLKEIAERKALYQQVLFNSSMVP